MEALPLLSASQTYAHAPAFPPKAPKVKFVKASTVRKIWAKKGEDAEKESTPKKSKQSLFGSVTEALDFSQVRSAEDAGLLDEAREATRAGGRMNKAQVNFILYRTCRFLHKLSKTGYNICWVGLIGYNFHFFWQYGALRRKIGGTYKDFFKAYVEGSFPEDHAS